MGPLENLDAFLNDIGCSVCDEPVAADRIRLLARRDDLLFLQVDCRSCGSTSLGFIADQPTVLEAAPGVSAPAMTSDDVLDMHELLAGWDGDLVGLLNGSTTVPGPAGGSLDRRAGRTA